ncbi:FtsX-like permease family protein [Streptomyces sp. TRM 70361]|uniref:FtsX-like permease family protein n=1 Tax=Streptomyces sp. TRM 70361 TaxID=3116553 RepID=UPI002E7C1749|nr:FtsX-like permease family protein [Streptomyces sp. TRM 70361]MEE1942671.1 FtsX-like permease family protein [Streptomyces sp. TRM 70361]
MRATLRWAHADLRAHRGEALLTVLATVGITASLLLAGALFSYAADPWQRTFTQSEGAHVWLHTRAGAETDRLTALDGVEGVSGPFRTVRATVGLGGARAGAELRATGPEPPEISRPRLTSGRWTRAGAGDEIVLESSLARALWAETGDTLTVGGTGTGTGSGAVPRTLRVVGVADTAEPRYTPGETPGTGWLSPRALRALAPAPDRTGQTVGLRLADPGDTDYTVQRAVTLLGADQITQVTRWQQARADAESDNRLLGLLLGLFGLGALLAAALAVSAAVSARVRGQLRDIAVLKAVGFTPAQVVRAFLVQHLGFALLGVACGAAVTELLGPYVPGRIGEAVQVWRQLPGHTWTVLRTTGAAVLFIAAVTSLAAWRAGRVPPVPVARTAAPRGLGALTAVERRLLGVRRLPTALVLGWRGAFAGRARFLADVARLAVPLLMVTVALGTWATLDRFESHPGEVGLPAALTVRDTTPGTPGTPGTSADSGAGLAPELRGLLAGHPDVTAVHPGAEVEALVPGQTGTITLRGLGTDADPYPFALAEGRAPHGPDEAVAGQGLLDLLDVRVGDWVRMTVQGRPQILHITGRSIEPDDGGRIIATSLDNLRENGTAGPGFHQLVLRDGADAAEVGAGLTAASGGRLEAREVANPADGLSAVRGVVLGLVLVLALIGLAELSTVIGARVRDRRRDLLALKAAGLTHRQIAGVVVASTGFTALAAALLGTAVGVPAANWLIDAQGRAGGVGAGIAAPPHPGALALVAVAAVLGAVAVSVLPAARLARRRIADTLSETL